MTSWVMAALEAMHPLDLDNRDLGHVKKYPINVNFDTSRCAQKSQRYPTNAALERIAPMPKRSMKQDDPLEDFTRRDIALDGVSKVVYVAGTGPAVIVMTEMPGISPHVARFARWVRDAGFTVYMPSLFGRDGAVPGAEEAPRSFSAPASAPSFARSPQTSPAP